MRRRGDTKTTNRTALAIAPLSAELMTDATRLSETSAGLAVGTAEQAQGILATSTTMESLSESLAMVVKAVEGVVADVSATQADLSRAKADIEASQRLALALASQMSEVGPVLVAINELAEQTTLLALNAAIEATRASGDPPWFGVVADELSRLAGRSNARASDILRLLDETQLNAQAALESADAGAARISEGVGLLEALAQSTAALRTRAQLGCAGVEEVAHDLSLLASNGQQTAAAASQLAASITALVELAAALQRFASGAGS